MALRACAVALLLSGLVASTGCASGAAVAKAPPTPADPPARSTGAGDPKELVREFWAALARRDPARAAALASFPFDLDAHNGCVQSEPELRDLLAKPEVPAETRIEIGAVREIPLGEAVAKPAAWPEDLWLDHLKLFTAPNAPCLVSAEATGDLTYRYYFVDFSVGGEAVGALTRLRCHGARCAVAGTDN